jgi:hypothetical protein
MQLIEDSYANPNKKLNEELGGLWSDFHSAFSEHFTVKHDSVMKSHYLQDKFKEILESDEWWEFVNLSRLTIFQKLTGKRRSAYTGRSRFELPFRCRGDAEDAAVLRVFV